MWFGPRPVIHVSESGLLLLMFGLPVAFLILILACWVGRNAAHVKESWHFQFKLSDLIAYNVALGISIGLQLLSVRWLTASSLPGLWVASKVLKPLTDMPYLAAAEALLWLFAAHFKPLSFIYDGKFRRSNLWACALSVPASVMYIGMVIVVEWYKFEWQR